MSVGRPARRPIPPRELRILWGRSGNICAFRDGRQICEQKLVGGADSTFVVGEAAHIHGVKPGSARYDPRAVADGVDLDAYDNLILLCSTHHTLVDDVQHRAHFSAMRLHSMKEEHEGWIDRFVGSRANGIARLKAEFVIDSDDGAPMRFKKDRRWHYVLNLWVENPPRRIESVRYTLHPTFPQPHIVIRTPPTFMLKQMKTYGDFYVKVTPRPTDRVATPAHSFYASLTEALKSHYGRRTTEPAREAIRVLARA